MPLNAADTVCKCYVIKILGYFLGGSRSDGEHGMEYCSRKCGVANAAGQQCCAKSFPVSHCDGFTKYTVATAPLEKTFLFTALAPNLCRKVRKLLLMT